MTEVRHHAKPGSGLADIVETRTYECTGSLAVCSKPHTVTDANGNTTTYAYESDGRLKTEEAPAIGGVAPAKKYGYTQRYAWISNGSGGFVHGAGQIWLLTEERSCQTSALNLTSGTCGAGANDLVTVSYDYGPDTGLVGNNLLLRGKVVTAYDAGTSGMVSLRTCYGYDNAGNKIWEIGPRAGLGACY